MAVEAEVTKVQAKLQLNNGTDADGNIKTVTISMPALSTTATPTQILTVVEELTPLLTKSVYGTQKVTYEALTD